MKTKKFLVLFLSVCLLAGLCCVPTSAEAATSGPCGKDATWTYDKNTHTLTVSGSGPMDCKTTETGGPWYTYQDEIQHVVIEDGITSVNDYAFNSYWYIKSIKLADSVKTIEPGAFSGCENLTDLDLGMGVTSMEEAFPGCKSLKYVVLPASLKTIGSENFSSSGLTSIAIPEGMTVIGGGAFRASYKLTHVYLPESITKVEYAAFRSCHELVDIYYGGTQEQWAAIDIDDTVDGKGPSNEPLFTATVHCNHKHSFDSGKITRKATCTQKGVKTYTCTQCGAAKQETISGKHSWDSGKVTAATCTKDGKKVFTCTTCQKTKTETITATGHNWGTGTTNADTTVSYNCKNCSAIKIEGTPVTLPETTAPTVNTEETIEETTVPSLPEDTTADENTPSENKDTPKDTFPWGIVIGISLAALAGGGTGLWFLLKKKK